MRLDPSDLVSHLWGSSALFPEKTLLPGLSDSAPPKQKATSTAAWCPSSIIRCCNAAFRNCFTVNFCPSSTEGNEGNEEHRDDSLHLPQAAAWYKLSLFLFLHFAKLPATFTTFWRQLSASLETSRSTKKSCLASPEASCFIAVFEE